MATLSMFGITVNSSILATLGSPGINVGEDEPLDVSLDVTMDTCNTMAYTGPSSVSSIGYVMQTLHDMQEEMDELAQSDLFVKEDEPPAPPTAAEKLYNMRLDYYKDMVAYADNFEVFQQVFTFAKPYNSEDPLDSFLWYPSEAALNAFVADGH